MADTYIAKLEEMEAAGVRTEEEHRQYHNTLALLCQVVPDLANYIDLETDTIEGGTAALPGEYRGMEAERHAAGLPGAADRPV